MEKAGIIWIAVFECSNNDRNLEFKSYPNLYN